jgi:type IV pilus assembly protein PilV
MNESETMHHTIDNREHGFGLIEALVALVVISVGMIGIAALYGQGLRASSTAYYRTQAVNLASDMADRIRVNRRGGASYGGAGANNNCDPGGGIDCSPAQRAAQDLFAWQAQVGNLLPGGVGVVQFAGTTPPTYTIAVTWQEAGLGAITHQIAVRIPNL